MARIRPQHRFHREVVEEIAGAKRIAASRLVFDRMPTADQLVDVGPAS